MYQDLQQTACRFQLLYFMRKKMHSACVSDLMLTTKATLNENIDFIQRVTLII